MAQGRVMRRILRLEAARIGTTHGREPIRGADRDAVCCATFRAMSGPPAAIPRLSPGQGAPATGVLEALAEHVARSPEDPALFYPEGLDVRWRSWRSLADQAAAGAVALSEAGCTTGDTVGFRWSGLADAAAADLAVQWAGRVSVPCSGPAEAGSAGCSAWCVQPGEERPAEGLPVVALPPAGRPWERRGDGGWPALPGPEYGGARVVEGGPSGGTAPGVRRLSRDEIAADARELGARLATAAGEADVAVGGPRHRGREIALASLDLRSRGGRALLSWGLLTGAALVLEPDPRALPASTAWVRPTLVAGEAAPLVELARQLRRGEGRRRRRWWHLRGPDRPVGRLRLLVVLGGGRLPVDDVPFWAERGVVVLRA